MQAQTIEITKFGAATDLEMKNIGLKDTLSDDEVLVEVNYSGVNFADIVMRLGMYKDAPPKPFTPGYEVSGTIKKIGKNLPLR